MKKEYAKLHERYTELFKTHIDYMERTKSVLGSERLEQLQSGFGASRNRIPSNLAVNQMNSRSVLVTSCCCFCLHAHNCFLESFLLQLLKMFGNSLMASICVSDRCFNIEFHCFLQVIGASVVWLQRVGKQQSATKHCLHTRCWVFYHHFDWSFRNIVEKRAQGLNSGVGLKKST